MNIKLTIAYNGTKYQGWQRLGGEVKGTSIQGILEDVISEFLQEDIKLIGSGRTDAGVHALGQVANFHTKKIVDCQQFRGEINLLLPKEIQIVHVNEVSEEFHSRYSARSKCYEYRIDNGTVRGVFARETTLFIPDKLDVTAMETGAKYLVGTHDFAGFSSKMTDGRGTVKTISEVKIECDGSNITILYNGDGFLYNMVRIMTGTLIEIGLKKRSPESVAEVLKTRNRQKAGKTVEGKGLFLVKVVY